MQTVNVNSGTTVGLSTLISGEDQVRNRLMVMPVYNYTTVSTIGTDTIFWPSPCVLHAITIGETAAGAITIKDGTTTVAVLKASIAEGTYTFDIPLAVNLTITRAAASKFVVSYL